MNLSEAESIAASVTFGAGVGMWCPRVKTRRTDELLLVDIAFHVPHRDTGAPSVVSMSWTIPKHDIAQFDAAAFNKFLLSAYLKFVAHEAMESLKINGQLVTDPHAS